MSMKTNQNDYVEEDFSSTEDAGLEKDDILDRAYPNNSHPVLTNRDKVSYKLMERSETFVNDTYSILIDLCQPMINGKPRDPQVIMRYRKNGNVVTRQPAFNEMDVTRAIIHAYEKGVFSQEAFDLLKESLFPNKN